MALHSSRTGGLEVAEQEFGCRRLEGAEETVKRWGSSGGEAGGGSLDFPELAAAVRELISLSSDGGAYGQRAKIALQAALGHLEDEFRQVLTSSTYFHPPDNLQASPHDSVVLPPRSFLFSSFPNVEARSISSSTTATDDSRTYCTGFSRDSVSMEKVHLYLIDPEASIVLKEIAELIILAGHASNLCHVYSETRHNTLMECLCLLGVHTEPKIHSPAAATAEGGCNMQLDYRKVKLWIQGLKIIVGTVLPEERDACAQIFGCDNMVKQDCFARATTRCTQQLLAVGSAIAKVKDLHYEKVPLLLQMQKELARLQPSLQDLLSGDAKDVVSQEASMLLDKLGEAALGLLLDFLILRFNREPDEKPALDGNILSLTQYVMGFIEVLSEYSDSLNLILPLEEEEDGIERTMSPFERYVVRLLSHLQLKILEKSESYKDERLRYIFLMNNAMYVLEYSRSSALRMSLRDDWIHEQLLLSVEQYATAYLRATWFAVLLNLREGKWGCTEGKRLSSVKESFKNFNSAFGEISRVQTTWKVPDPQLRQHLRIVILHQVLQAYRTYLGRFGYFVDNNSTKYIKYTPEDIEDHVLDLFEGLEGSTVRIGHVFGGQGSMTCIKHVNFKC